MEKALFTRRDCAKTLMMAGAPGILPARQEWLAAANDGVAFRVLIEKGKLVSRQFRNKLSNETVELAPEDFALEFAGGLAVTSTTAPVSAVKKTDSGFEMLSRDVASGFEFRVQYTAPPDKTYLRKQIAVRRLKGSPARLMRADLENWTGVKRNWDSMHADSLPYGSHPIFCESLWAGVEFIAAFNQYGKDGFVLRSRPGGKTVGADWVNLRSTVVGSAEPGRVRDAFLAYIEDIRLAPPRWVACYNSWWTLPLLVKQKDYLALMRDLKENLADKHGVFFDLVATDAGWNDPKSIWEIDWQSLPNGFKDMRSIVESAGGKTGLWISPGEEYKPNFDYEWGKQNGYVVLENKEKGAWAWDKGVSIADPKYREQTKSQLRKLIKENNFDHIKYDGLVAREEQGHHDLLPGDDSVEPIAEYSLELMQVSKEANPNLVTEPTYLNSWANYISPWIIKYADTVWGNAGGDCPLAICAAPDYREAHTSAREYFIFRSLNEVWLPQDALQYFDIVHCDDEPGFANHAAMAFGRGRFFLSTYLNPKFMTDDDWRIYAGLLKWARKNTSILRNTNILTSRVEAGEPYAYAHWLGQRGIIALRNPANESAEYVLDLAKSGAPAGLRDAICYTQYPYRKGIAAGVDGRSRIKLQLAPWELIFIEVAPRSELKEAVVIGGRWYRETSTTLAVAPDRGSERVRLIDPSHGERDIPVRTGKRETITGEILKESRFKAPESAWLNEKEKPVPTIAFELECSVAVPKGADGRVLLLVQYPGRRHHPNAATATCNGAQIKLREKSSPNHIGYYMPTPASPWKDIMPYETQWTWYIAEVPAGGSKLTFTGSAAGSDFRIGVWAWCEWDVRRDAFRLEAACTEPEMPAYQDQIERAGICIKRPA